MVVFVSILIQEKLCGEKMKKKKNLWTLIFVLFIFLYSFPTFFEGISIQNFYLVIIAFLFFLLAIGVYFLKEWGRTYILSAKFLIVFSFILGILELGKLVILTNYRYYLFFFIFSYIVLEIFLRQYTFLKSINLDCKNEKKEKKSKLILRVILLIFIFGIPLFQIYLLDLNNEIFRNIKKEEWTNAKSFDKSKFIKRKFISCELYLPKDSIGMAVTNPERLYNIKNTEYWLWLQDDLKLNLLTGVGSFLSIQGYAMFEVFGVQPQLKNEYDYINLIAESRFGLMLLTFKKVGFGRDERTVVHKIKTNDYIGFGIERYDSSQNKKYYVVDLWEKNYRDYLDCISLRFRYDVKNENESKRIIRKIVSSIKPTSNLGKLNFSLKKAHKIDIKNKKNISIWLNLVGKAFNELEQTSTNIYFKKAKNDFEKGNYEDCKWNLINFLHVNPKSIEANMLFAKCFIAEKKWRLASWNVRRVLKIDPNNKEALELQAFADKEDAKEQQKDE